MKIDIKYAARSTLILICLSMMSSSVFAAWGEGDSEHAGHDKNQKMQKSWGGGNANMGMSMGEGFMTARLRAIWTLDLTKDQKSKIRAIQRETRAMHWELEDKIEITSDKLFELYKNGIRDAKAIGKVYSKMFDYRRQIIENGIEAGNKAEAVLTTEQWKYLKKDKHFPKWGGGWKK